MCIRDRVKDESDQGLVDEELCPCAWHFSQLRYKRGFKGFEGESKRVSGMNIKAIATQEDWTQCTKEQVLTKLEALSRKKLVPYARTRFNNIFLPHARSEDAKLSIGGGIHCA
eukprot:12914100-Prorocentrum_lima.AAC.1